MRLLLLCVFVANVVFAATLPTGTMDDALEPGMDVNGTMDDALQPGTDVNGTMDDALEPGTDVNGTMDDALEPGTDVNGTDSTVTNLKFSSPNTTDALEPGTDVNGTMDDALEPGTDVNGTDSTVTNLKFSSPSTDAAIFTSSPGNKRIKRDDADNTKAKDTCTSNGGANCQTGVVAILTERNGLAKQLEDNKKLQEAMKVEFASYASGKIVTVALLAVFMVIFILLLAAVLVDAFVFNKLFQRATSSASV